MKWFEVESTTPDDDKIQTILREFGNRGLGALFRLWCHVAAKGSKPGLAVDSAGRPFELKNVARRCGVTVHQLRAILQTCATIAHIDAELWKTEQIIFFPAMAKRADEYTKRKEAKFAKRKGVNGTGGADNQSETNERKTAGSPDSVGISSGEYPRAVLSCTVLSGVSSTSLESTHTDRARALIPPPEQPKPPVRHHERRRHPRDQYDPPIMAGTTPWDHRQCLGPCVRICLPVALAHQFAAQLGGDHDAAFEKIRKFRNTVIDAIPAGAEFGDRPYDFWRKHFAASFASIAPAIPATKIKRDGPDPAAMRTSAPDDKYDHLTRRSDDDDQDQEGHGRKPS